MKLEKAIEILKLDAKLIASVPRCDLEDAEKLGIEALERLQFYRKDNWHLANIPLTSETQDTAHD